MLGMVNQKIFLAFEDGAKIQYLGCGYRSMVGAGTSALLCSGFVTLEKSILFSFIFFLYSTKSFDHMVCGVTEVSMRPQPSWCHSGINRTPPSHPHIPGGLCGGQSFLIRARDYVYVLSRFSRV